MKLFALSAIAACATVVFASPAGHMNLAKRATDATNTLIADGKTYVEVIEGTQATVFDTKTVTQTVTETATDYSYVFEYTGDDQNIISRLQDILSGVFDGIEGASTAAATLALPSVTSEGDTSIPSSFVTGIIVPSDVSQPVGSQTAPFSFTTGTIVPSTALDVAPLPSV